MLYWKIGERIRTDVLQAKRAGYGEEILQTLSAKLAVGIGNGRVATAFGEQIFSTPSEELDWMVFVGTSYPQNTR
jgi:hypothetical protein